MLPRSHIFERHSEGDVDACNRQLAQRINDRFFNGFSVDTSSAKEANAGFIRQFD
jgi:hypothetical protein